MRKNSLRIGIVFLAGTLATASGLASTPAKVGADFVEPVESVHQSVSYDFDKELFKKQMAFVKSKRGPAASADIEEQDFSEVFRNEFFPGLMAAKTPDQLDAFIRTWGTDAKFNSSPNDVKFVAAQLSLLVPYRSIVFRMKSLFETNKSVHSASVSALRSVASSVTRILPTDQWKAGFDYVTVPSSGQGKTQFANVAQFQAFIGNTLPHWNRALQRLHALESAMNGPIVFDNKLAYGTAAFPDKSNRFRFIDSAEMKTAIAAMHTTVASFAVFCAYNHNDMLQVAEELGRLAGMNGFMADSITGKLAGVELGVSSRDRLVSVFGMQKGRITKHASYLTLLSDGSTKMALAYENLKIAAEYEQAAFELASTRPANPLFALSSDELRANSKVLKAKHDLQTALMNGPAEVQSPITNEKVILNLKAFYLNPPRDLKVFFPVSFDESPSTSSIVIDGQKVAYRNYYRGRATGWRTGDFAAYVPSASGKSSAYMGQALSTLRLSYGSDFVFTPIAAFIH